MDMRSPVRTRSIGLVGLTALVACTTSLPAGQRTGRPTNADTLVVDVSRIVETFDAKALRFTLSDIRIGYKGKSGLPDSTLAREIKVDIKLDTSRIGSYHVHSLIEPERPGRWRAVLSLKGPRVKSSSQNLEVTITASAKGDTAVATKIVSFPEFR
jgi:hypothetical protein